MSLLKSGKEPTHWVRVLMPVHEQARYSGRCRAERESARNACSRINSGRTQTHENVSETFRKPVLYSIPE